MPKQTPVDLSPLELPSTIVLGTRNLKKRVELEYLLAPYHVAFQTLHDFPHALEVEEDGDSFAANAAKKAIAQAMHLNAWVLGEDSGLAVDALAGAPGVFSARYASAHGDDEANNAKLLKELEGVPAEARTAHYVCHATLADPLGRIVIDCEGICRGRIRRAPSGIAGFGYDPLFEIPEYHKTFGELGPATKAALSHRARAIRDFLRAWCHWQRPNRARS